MSRKHRPGVALSQPFVVEVRDQIDNPLEGAQIAFTITAGSGTLSATTATTAAMAGLPPP